MTTETEDLIRTLLKNTMGLTEMHRTLMECIKIQTETTKGLLERVKALENRSDDDGEVWKRA